MTVTQDLFDKQVEHSIRLRRYSESTRLLLERVSRTHRSRLREILKGNIKANFRPEVRRYVKELLALSKESVKDFFGAEIDFQTNSLRQSVGDWYKVQRPTRAEMVKNFTRQPLVLGGTDAKGSLERSMANIEASEITRINAKIRRGIANGDSQDTIIRGVLKTSKLSENQAKTLVTTNLTHAESAIKQQMYEKNPELFSGAVYSSILDSRTSKTCSSLDGRFQEADNIKYRPPMHWNCRSTLVWVLKSKTALLEDRSSRINHDVLSKIAEGQLSGQQPLKETFTEWLRRQPHKTKLQYLGTDEKVALLQEDTLSMKDFLTIKGNPISLAALRTKDALATYFLPVRQTVTARITDLHANRPFQVVRSKKLQAALRELYLEDATHANNPLSLVDYKGTTIAGKKAVRSRVNNVYDPRTQTIDPITGEIKNTLYYDPDFAVYRERVDYMNNSKLLDRKQKAFIETFADSFDNRISTNQKTAIVENLRVVFERYQKDRTPWESLPAVLRREMQFSVVNTSRILDRRSRARAELFEGFTGDVKEPSVMILGEKFTIDELHADKLKYQHYIDNWTDSFGDQIGQDMFYARKAPWRAYFFNRDQQEKTLGDKLLGSFKKQAVRKIFYRDNPEGFYLRYGKVDGIKKILKDWLKDQVKIKSKAKKYLDQMTKEGLGVYLHRVLRENYRYIVDLEFYHDQKRKLYRQWVNFNPLRLKKEKEVTRLLGSLAKTVAQGITTDYDTLAIQLGQRVIQTWQPFYWKASSLSDFHREGSRILDYMRDQGYIRVNSRGVTRRAVTDLDTLRPSGAWKDTVSREVQVLDESMLELQKNQRAITLSNRLGVERPANKYYVRPGHKTYFDARGKDTGVPMVTRSAFEKFDAKLIDKDFANALNWQMASQYEVDPEFATFMDYLVRFKDNRGNAAYYDSINGFREEVIRRGDLGYGLMETVRYYNAKGTPFTVHARIDGRGRMYYNGYLTPTGGEVVRPFLNSANATAMTPGGVKQIQIQMAAVIGPGTEALSTAGRLAIFKRHEKDILRVGELLTKTTQRDRRIREFLEDPFMKTIDSEEIAKIARFSLEYYRIHKHVNGDFSDTRRLATYKSKLMGEADASASGLQVIALSTGNRGAALSSNVIPTYRKQRVYDLTAQDTASDPRFLAMLDELGINLTWEDLGKAAKYQNMIALYGAGQTGQTARVAAELANVLRKKDFTVTTRSEYLAIRKKVDQKIKEAEQLGAEDAVADLQGLRREMDELMANPEKVSDTAMMLAAEEIHPDVADFVAKYSNNRTPRIGPENFKLVARILSEKLAERAPVTQVYIDFWKRVAADYARTTKKVDIPWVTFDKKKFVQKYRPKVQYETRFYDPESKRYIRNIYQMTAPDGKLQGKGSIGAVRLGLAVNGNHSLDASLLRMYHNEGRQKGIPTASIHDAIFHNINQLDEGTEMFFHAYQTARDADNIRWTLEAIRDAGLPDDLFRAYLKEAEELGFFDNGFSSAEILRPLKAGEDRYGIGP